MQIIDGVIIWDDGDIHYDIDVDLHNKAQFKTVPLHQYDANSVYILSNVWDDGNIFTIPTNAIVTFSATNPDGKGIDNECKVIDNQILYQVTELTTAKDGNFDAEFRIYNTITNTDQTTASALKGSPKFRISVEKSALNNDTIVSANEFNVLTKLINDTQTTINDVNTAKDATVTATTNANNAIATITQTNTTVNTAEQTRIANENVRIQAEELRPDYKYVTQAEYDILPQVDKDNPKYIYEITDNDGEFPTNLQTLINDVATAKNNYDASVSSGSDLEVVEARTSGVTGATSSTLKNRLDSVDEQLASIPTQTYITEKAKTVDVNNALVLKANQSALDTTNNSISLKADKSYVDTQVQAIASGSPKGVYATLANLQTAFPTGNTNIYLVTADGKWYYWNDTAWTAGGVYQGVGIVNESIVTDKYAQKSIGLVELSKNIYNFNGYFVNAKPYVATDPIFVEILFNLGSVPSSDYNKPYEIEYEFQTSDANISQFGWRLTVNNDATVGNITGGLLSLSNDYGTVFEMSSINRYRSIRTDKHSGTYQYAHVLITAKRVDGSLYSNFYFRNVKLKIGDIKYQPMVLAPKTYSAYPDSTISEITKSIFDIITRGEINNIITDSRVSKWREKKIAMLGDSITWYDGHNFPDGTTAIGYPTLMNEAMGFNSVLNWGISGACIAEAGSTSVYKDIVVASKEINYSGYDLVTIAGGTNDFDFDIPLGTLGVSTDTSFDNTTFYGAYREIIEYILSSNSSIQIVLWTPLKRSGFDIVNNAGLKLADYVDAIRQIGEFYSIPVLDLFSKSGVNKLNLSTYTIDNLHLNNTGFERVTNNVIVPFLETV